MNKKHPRVTLYTTRGCSHCRRLKTFLQKHKIPFAELDIERNRRAFMEFQRMGGRGVPLITIGNRRLNGFQQDPLIKALKGAGFNV